MKRIYLKGDNPFSIPYKSTKVGPIRSKASIDSILARFGVKDVAWRWDLPNDDVFVSFQIVENTSSGEMITPVVKIEPPKIWVKKKGQPDRIAWKICLRLMYWYIKTHLEMAYLWQEQKTMQFLPHISITKDRSLGDILVERFNQIATLEALPEEVVRQSR